MTSVRTAIGLSSPGGVSLGCEKGGIDIRASNPFILPVVGTMTIITTFISPYMIKYGRKILERFKPKKS